LVIFTSLESPHNSLQNEPKIAKNGSLSSSMYTTEVLFKFLKFLPLWLLMANKACKISEKPALKKPDGHPSINCYFILITSLYSYLNSCRIENLMNVIVKKIVVIIVKIYLVITLIINNNNI